MFAHTEGWKSLKTGIYLHLSPHWWGFRSLDSIPVVWGSITYSVSRQLDLRLARSVVLSERGEPGKALPGFWCCRP